MDKDLEGLTELAKEVKEENIKYFKRLKKRVPKRLDLVVREIHEEEFERTDCLTCGNCCKTTSPMFTHKDIERIAKHLKMKVADFITQYLKIDEDDFHVLKTAPCSFLDERDNSCFIYDVRPKACSEYPHTNRKKFIQLADITVKNTEICPATYRIMEELKKRLPSS
ncbi:YkgJ family cysteine cluster protein [Tenacibaculum sp. MAR_2009_124]|uniref:YkgJ family cysteine cluster protein n=1 Tax=Tenacibaculum sp. MAR_2009_124 TaxID=1250059 RepID=UPI000B887AEC|nr:YkgJ family cysteine cluster protein [Tenacibaculum sp. MAR_2009_124]